MELLAETLFDGFAERRYKVPFELCVSRIFLDIETLSLKGSPLTVIGLVSGTPDPAVMQLYLLREEGERNMLEHFLALVRDAEVVTYNGANFDLPFINQRLRYHGLKPYLPFEHRDLYLEAKKRYQGRFPSLKQSFLERHLLGIERHDDIPSRFVPDRFMEFLYQGDRVALEKVLRHNYYDIVGLASLYFQMQGSLF
ncbi:hypothetical protein HPY42_00035 [Coprothermobacteraceae bacterium]|nr:hypothetical protein [Coprothermobacteraceae bacterium]